MSRRKPRILLTNDDGYFSDGINAAFDELSQIAEVYMVAPDREQSASSHSLTLNRPLRVHKIDTHHFTTDGTPTDCVMLAMHLIFSKRKPDMIVSGINHGGNMGDDVTYSGTIAATIEGSILKIPSIAVSMANYEPGMSMLHAAQFVRRVVEGYPALNLKPTTFLNINLPSDSGRPYEKYEFTRQGVRRYQDVIIKKKDPRGKAYYWIGGQPKWRKVKGSDFAAIDRGIVSITPLRLNFTDQESLDRFRAGKFDF